MQYKAYSLRNLKALPQIADLSRQQIRDIEIVGAVLPFRVNNYVAERLIDWSKIPVDPMFITTFPQKGMLLPQDYKRIEALYYFSVPLVEAWKIFKDAYQSVSGICRTVRGPSMSCLPGKIQVTGASDVKGEKVLILQMIQGRNPDWVDRPFLAAYDEDATWYNELRPAFGEERFFFEEELASILQPGETEIDFEC